MAVVLTVYLCRWGVLYGQAVLKAEVSAEALWEKDLGVNDR